MNIIITKLLKRIVTIMTISILLVLSVTVHAATPHWIDKAQACLLGQTYLKMHSGMSMTDYCTYYIVDSWQSTLADGTPLWNIHFLGDMNDPRYATNAYIVYVHGYSGEFKGLDYPTVPNPVTAEFNKLRKEIYQKEFVLWTIQQKYDFSQTFPQLYQDFETLSLQNDINYMPVSDHLKQLLQYDFRLPDENCITQEEAIGFAKEALKAVGNFTDEELSTCYMNASSFLYSYQFASDGELVWKIFFIPTPPHSPDYGYYVEVNAHNGKTVGIKHQIQSKSNPWALIYE